MATDSITITDSISLTLNDANTLFHTESDSLTLTDSISPAWQPSLTDTLSFSETIAFTLYHSIYNTVAIDDITIRVTGLLFGFEEITDTMAYSEVVAGSERDSVYETGDYGSSDVFVHTDLTNIGVFE
jgi:hypothetical protein